MRRLFIAFLFLLIAAVIGAAAVMVAVSWPYAGFGKEVFVDIPPGTGIRRMAGLLTEAKVIRTPWQFYMVRAIRPKAVLMAGEYRFHQSAGAWDVFDRIARGDVFYYLLVVPEGSNLFEIAGILDAQGIVRRDDFLGVARNPSMVKDLAPQAPSLEGYLFPDTYRYTRRATAESICRMMTGRFRRVWNSIQGSAAEVHRTVTMASLVEKETGVQAERGRVSSVFHNRIEKGMPLQCDPTSIYAAMLEGRWRGNIYLSDLRSSHPYNTYVNRGLPPGPIANPGKASLLAAIQPDQTEYIYFVAKPDQSGAHVFSSSLSAHNRAVQELRRVNQKAVEASASVSSP